MIKRVNSVNFNGIKNIGYTKSYSKYDNGINNVKYTINMQLTDDNKNQDLKNYYKLINENPQFLNKIDSNFLNIEVNYYHDDYRTWYLEKINGVNAKNNESNSAIRKFARNMVNRISEFKPNEIKTERFHKYTTPAEFGLIQNEDILDYIDEQKGELELLKGTGFGKKFREFCTKDNYSEANLIKLFKIKFQIIDCLHNPQYVQNGAKIMDALLKTQNNLKGN